MIKISLINPITAIYLNNHQKQQLVEFLKVYPCIIYVKNYLEVIIQIEPKV